MSPGSTATTPASWRTPRSRLRASRANRNRHGAHGMVHTHGTVLVEAKSQAMKAAGGLYHAYFTGLILTLVTRRSATDAAEWVFRVFRHQHHEKFLSSFAKLGLDGL